ncbi:MAG: excinuclease ABC subunit UvrA [Candidatus Aminicenantes bacterium]|nr:excinuclease ABC subunit UvrA [Candidatus Aminicenantes bacterium]
MDFISIRHAAEHNLKEIDVDIPRGRITVVTGVSGSGKSSLVFDVVFREAQRRYLETFSSHARQFLGKLRRPEVGLISGLSPAVAVGQRTSSPGPRSTVGTMTELHDDLRLLFARLGSSPDGLRLTRRMFSFNTPEGACSACRGLGVEDRIDPELLISDPARSLRQGALTLTTPNGYIIYSQVTMDVLDLVCRSHGFSVDIPWRDLTGEQRDIVLNGSDRIRIPFGKHPLESRLRWKGIAAKPREEGFYRGILPIMETILKTKRNDSILRFARTLPCRACGGRRLRPESLRVKTGGRSISDFSAMGIRELAAIFREMEFAPEAREAGQAVRRSILQKADMLERLGLGYLRLERPGETLSGGEIGRIRLAAQAGSGLRGVLYVFDEPTAGLHPSDTARLLELLGELRDNGNTVLVVEHDEDVMRAADHLLDLGPGPGEAGGRVLYSGPPAGIALLPRASSPTRDDLSGDRAPAVRPALRPGTGRIVIRGARKHNLRGFDVEFRLGAFNVVTGVSGAGKSTLVHQILADRLKARRFGPGPDAEGLEFHGPPPHIIEIDSSPIGRTPRSNPATYTNISGRIRDLFASLPESRAHGFGKGRFSFNVAGGRCETCQGAGLLQVGMHFLGDVDVVCPDCEGRRFNDETLAVRDRGKNIHDVLEMSVDEAAAFYAGTPTLSAELENLRRLGLGYIRLGQSSTTLSGGEAQRVKLASEWGRGDSGQTVYILDEPTSGLHRADVENLLASLQGLVSRGRTVVAVEHHLDLIRAADWVVDLGPGSGEEGGRLVVCGTPEEAAACPASVTGRALRGETAAAAAARNSSSGNRAEAKGPIILEGVTTHNLKGIDVRIPFEKFTVVSGPSGSGKSSLVFDTLFAASRQRYIESFSAYVRALIDKGGRADFAAARGLTPPVAVGRAAFASNPRSTVGTMTEIHDYYRLLYSRAGTIPPERSGRPLSASMFSFNHEQGACPRCKGLGMMTVADPERLITHPDRPLISGALDGTKTGRFYGEPHGQHVAALKAAGQAAGLDVSLPYERLTEEARVLALQGTGDRIYDIVWSYKRGNRTGDFKFRGPWKGLLALVGEEYERKHADHRGEAMRVLMKDVSCPDCGGRRLKLDSLRVTFRGLDIAALSALNAAESLAFFEQDDPAAGLEARAAAVTAALRLEIIRRLRLIRDVGLDYLGLDRPSSTLSGGEAQRLRLAGLLGVRLSGVTFILDEPTLGLHSRDTARLLGLIRELAAEGNTVVAVEHDPEVIRSADHVIDIGPGAGRSGGRITAEGSPVEIRKSPFSVTGPYLAPPGDAFLPLSGSPAPGLEITGAKAHNLQDVDVSIPAGVLTAVTGVSGSGKSSLVFDVLLASAQAGKPVSCADIRGLDRFANIVAAGDDLPAATPSSIPLTYLGLFDSVRTLFAASGEARAEGFTKSHFSFLTPEGRCEACGGSGRRTVSLDYLADVAVPCETCRGTRYNPDVLKVRLSGQTIADVLALTAAEGAEIFTGRPKIADGLRLLAEIGLDYLQLGQPLDTLSSGELQRLKLASELIRPAAGRILYLFDEPTAGLHPSDIDRLLRLFGRLLTAGQTIVAVEHNLELIRRAGHVIDLGPEGGRRGGRLIIQGSPPVVAACPGSYTGEALRALAAD